jgi:hypothetical protein
MAGANEMKEETLLGAGAQQIPTQILNTRVVCLDYAVRCSANKDHSTILQAAQAFEAYITGKTKEA